MSHREKTITLKFDTTMTFHYESISPGILFMRAAEGENGNIYVKSAKKGAAPHNVTRPGIMVFPSDRETVYIRVF